MTHLGSLRWKFVAGGGAVLAVLAGGAMAQKAPPKVTSLDGQTIAAGELHEAYYHWTGQTVTVVAYPALFWTPDPFQKRIEIGTEPVKKAPVLAECTFAETPEGEMHSDVTLVLRGKFDSRFFEVPDGQPPRIKMNDCELLSTGDAMPSEGDPWTISDEPIAIDALHKAVFGWEGQKVRVAGYYKSTTVSSVSGGELTSHDLQAGQGGPVVVECRQPGNVDAPASVIADRGKAVVEGTFSKGYGRTVILEDCGFVEG